MANEWFSEWFGTDYYKMLYGNRNNSEAEALVQSILTRTSLPKGAAVWDMACGRGRHLFWFDQAGMTTYGSDLSTNSIEEASKNVPSAALRVHDMRKEAPFASEMDLTVNLFTSMGYFADPDDDLMVLKRAYDSVRAGGYFVLDFLNADTVEANLIPQSEKVVNDVRFVSERSIESGFIVKRIRVHAAGQEHQFKEQVRAYSPSMLAALLEQVGFSVTVRLGRDMMEPLAGSDRCVLLAKKS